MRSARIATLALAGAVALWSQERRYNGNGHVYFSGGVCQHNYTHIGGGGGGEAFVWRGLAVGGDIGYHRFINDTNFGLASFTVGYHFVDRKSPGKFEPFVNITPAGFYFGAGTGGAGGLGGGLNYWFKQRIGLRTEARVHVLANEEALVIVRIGLSFR